MSSTGIGVAVELHVKGRKREVCRAKALQCLLQARQRRLATFQLASSLDPLPIDQAVADAWAGLVATLRDRGQRMPINDSWISATAIAHDMSIVTRDHDFDVLERVRVVRL
jgi:hypothetical protein